MREKDLLTYQLQNKIKILAIPKYKYLGENIIFNTMNEIKDYFGITSKLLQKAINENFAIQNYYFDILEVQK